MAQNVTIAGASYEDVPSVDMPTTGGGTSSFFDVSDTTATAADVASGKVFYSAAGVRSTGTASGGGSGVSVFYGACATAAATAAKAVVCEEFTSSDLVEGTTINVKFTYAQTYNGAPTLNVNSTGAHNIKRVGTTNAARYEWLAGEVLQFVYDGTYWMLTDGGIATTTYYGVTKLSSSTSSTSNALAATASAVKAAYDLANGKQDALVSGTNIKTINNESLLGEGNITIEGGGGGPEPSSTTPAMDGTAAVGTSTTYARADHVHPSDSSKQDVLVSGTNIKLINNQSLLGSGTLIVRDLPDPSDYANGSILMIVGGIWRVVMPKASATQYGMVMVDGTSITATDGVISVAGSVATHEVTITLTNPLSPSSFQGCVIWQQDSAGLFPEVQEEVGRITSATGSATVTVSMPYIQVEYRGTSVSVGTATCTGGVSLETIESSAEIYAVTGDGTIVSDGVDYND